MTDFTYQEGTPLTWAQMNENLRLMQAKYLDASNNAAIAIAAANFKGNWSSLTGPLAVPASVYHAGEFWILLTNIASVAANTPGVSASWAIAGNVRKTGDTMTGTLNVGSGGSVLVTGSGGLGYGVGSGGTVVQATSKSTAVTLNKPSGQITMNNAALAAGATVAFQLANSLLATSDGIVIACIGGVSSLANYRLSYGVTAAGIASIYVTNQTGGSLSEAIVLNFQKINGATS